MNPRDYLLRGGLPGGGLCAASIIAMVSPATRWQTPVPEPVRTVVIAVMFLAGLAMMLTPLLMPHEEEREDEEEP